LGLRRLLIGSCATGRLARARFAMRLSNRPSAFRRQIRSGTSRHFAALRSLSLWRHSRCGRSYRWLSPGRDEKIRRSGPR
jgi:hypothetical protein